MFSFAVALDTTHIQTVLKNVYRLTDFYIAHLNPCRLEHMSKTSYPAAAVTLSYCNA